MTQQIPLSQGKFAIVDDEDFDWLMQCKWTYDAKGYAYRKVKKVTLFMHRAILNASGPVIVDHINGNGLDNRRCNLRIVTVAQNVYNQRPQTKNKTSQFKGVVFSKRLQRWQAYIKKGSERRYLGTFDDELDAARAYNAAARHFFGPNAYVNEVNDDTLTFSDLYRKPTSSGYRGVHFDRQSGKWKAQIQVNKAKIFLGYYTSELDAARAYDSYVIANGLRSRLNVTQQTT